MTISDILFAIFVLGIASALYWHQLIQTEVIVL